MEALLRGETTQSGLKDISNGQNPPLPKPQIPPKQRHVKAAESAPIARIPHPLEANETIKDVPTSSRRHLPLGNGVSNLLYARRLPSPPIYRRDTAVRRSQKKRCKDDSALVVANHLTKQESSSMRKLVCPLCAQTFGYGFGLECHLLSVHLDELGTYKRDELSRIRITNCPYCKAQFLRPAAALRHLYYQHPAEAAGFFVVNKSSLISTDVDMLRCRFCEQRFLSHHQKLMLLHVEQKHLVELEEILTSSRRTRDGLVIRQEEKASPELAMMLSTTRRRRDEAHGTFCREAFTLADDHQFVTEEALRLLQCGRAGNCSKRSLGSSSPDSPPHHYWEIVDENSPVVERKPFAATPFRRSKKRVKRESVKRTKSTPPDSTRTPSVESSKTSLTVSTSLPFTSLVKKSSNNSREGASSTSSSAKLLHQGTAHHRSKSLNDAGVGMNKKLFPACISGVEDQDMQRDEQLRMFKCNLCGVAFLENAFLLTHLKNKHHGGGMGKALKPNYACGACPAKFFKNNFLAKHVEKHQFQLLAS